MALEIFDLPKEIRLMIFSFAFGGHKFKVTNTSYNRLEAHSTALALRGTSIHEPSERNHHTIIQLTANRRLYDEALETVYQDNIFSCLGATGIANLTDLTALSPAARYLRFVEVTCNFTPALRLATKSFRSLRQLKEVHLRLGPSLIRQDRIFTVEQLSAVPKEIVISLSLSYLASRESAPIQQTLGEDVVSIQEEIQESRSEVILETMKIGSNGGDIEQGPIVGSGDDTAEALIEQERTLLNTALGF